MAEPFLPLSRSPEANFLFQGVQPPGQLYLAPEDQMRLAVWNSIVGNTIGINGRILLSNGEIVPFLNTFTPSSNRTLSQFVIPPIEGFLLSLSVIAGSASVHGGSCYCLVDLFRNPVTALIESAVLAQGYVNFVNFLSWPVSRSISPREGPGVIRSIAGTDPAAGVEIIETVPTGAVWKILSFFATLATSIAVANRAVSVAIDDGTNAFARVFANGVQAASTTNTYNFLPRSIEPAATNLNYYGCMPLDMTLSAGYRIRTLTALLDAADDWGAPRLLVEEWVEP